ncbi:M36 family metallopeptidase [bacterium]|nr:M36 family metallopeptidase [bacterium]
MRARRDRLRPTSLTLTRLEDRSVPAGIDTTPLPPPPPYTPDADYGLNFLPPSYSLGGADYLTGPQAGDPLVLARQALAAYAPALGLSAADIASAIVTDGYADTSGGMYHAYFKQSFNGLEVFNTSVGVHVTADGRVLTVNGGFVPGIGGAATGVAPTPVVSATGAVAAAASYFGITLTSAPVLTSTTGSPDQHSVVAEPEASQNPITTRLVYVNTAQGVRPAWEFNLDVPGGDHWYNVAVDAATGQVTFWSDWVEHYSATYNALPTPAVDPVSSPRQIVVNPWDVAASPFGWHDTNGIPGAERTDTRGNNVNAQADPTNTDASNFRPDGGTNLIFNYALNLASPPLASVDAAVTNLFYLNNVLHDVHFKYGFTEAAGNFQFKNYTNQGLGNDAVEADAQDNSLSTFPSTNNANFATPPDGFAPRMQMYVFDLTNPFRDGDFANEIVVHEYGHGVSTRLTGGPANANSLSTVQSAGMGEGWSDFWALMFTQTASKQANDPNPIGTWVGGDPPSGPGGRRFPYSFDMSVDPLTFNDYNLDRSFFGQPEVHNTGEIWTSALWDMNWLLINKYGFDKDLSTGFQVDPVTKTPVNGPAGAGNKLALQLVMNALKLQPANPTFVQARDYILQADLALTGGQNQREIWTAFARRGLGAGASTSNSNAITVNTSFALPATLGNPAVIAQTPTARVVGGPAPTSVTLTFSEAMDTSSFDPASDIVSFTGPGGVDLKPSVVALGAAGFTWVTPTQLRVSFTSPAAAEGGYQLVVGPDIRSADTGSQMDQDLSGSPGTAADRYTANFQYDSVALVPTLTAVPSASNPNVPAKIVATFSEPVNPTTVGTGDLQVSRGTVSAATVVAPNVVEYDLTGVTTGPVYVTLPYGAVSDPFGFPSEAANGTFGQAPPSGGGGTPFPPLTPFGPLGWGSYASTVSDAVSLFGEVDSYTIDLDAGTSLAVLADQLTTLRAQVSILDPSGAQIALGTSFLSGNSASAGPVVVPFNGTYTIKITGTSNSTGEYRLRALVTAGVESESLIPSAYNDTRGFPSSAAENLDGLIRTQGGPGSTLRGVTLAGNVGQNVLGGDLTDNYLFTPTVGPAGPQQITVGLSQLSGGATLTLVVTDQNGAAVTPVVTVTPTNFNQAITFTPPTNFTGRYIVSVRLATPIPDGIGSDYALSLILNGAMDLEDNNTPAAAAAKPAALNGNLRGGLTSGDEDWYQITVPTGGVKLYLTSLTPGDGPNQPDNPLDPHVEVYNTTGSLIAGSTGTDNAAADGKNSALAVDLPAGVYTIRVLASPLVPSSSGSYIVQLTTAANPGPVTPTTGGPYTVIEGQSLQLNGGATDPNDGGAALTYSWDLNGDGVFGDVLGRTPLVSWASLVALGINDGPGTFNVQLQASDGVNPLVTSLPSTLRVDNAPPAAEIYIGATGTATTQTVNEGQTGVVVRMTSDTDSAAAPTDPSPVDVSAVLRYSYDLNGDGLFNDGAGAGDGTYAGSAAPTSSVVLPPSAFADGSAAGTAVTIKARVLDKDGGFVDKTVTFTVLNVAPSATGVTGNVTEGVDGTVTVLNPTDPSNTGPASDQATLRYSFELDLDNDGTFETTLGGTTYATALTSQTATVPAASVPDGPATIKVRATVYDKDGASFTTATTDITVGNTAPTGTVSATPQVDEGTTAVVQLTGVSDPSADDTAAGFRYAYDFNNNGSFNDPEEIGGGSWLTSVPGTTATSSSATVPARYLADGDLTGTTVRTVRVRVYDFGDGFTDYTVDISVLNVAPTAVLTGSPTTLGSPLVVSLTGQADASSFDTQAGFLYSFDFNDGDFADPEDVIDSATATAQFTYTTPNSSPGKQVWARITDKDGGSTTYTQFFVVNNVQPSASLAFPATVTEGGTASITVTASHPSAATVAAGFRYAYDFDGDGTFDFPSGATSYATASPQATATVPSAFTADGLRPLAVRVRVFEVNGLSTDVVAPIQVLNAPPTATFSGPATTVEVGDSVTFRFSGATDPAAADVAAGFRYSIDLNNDGDFTDDGEVADSASGTVTTSFRTTGPRTVRGRVTDKDGGFTDYFVTASARVPVKIGYAAGVESGNAPIVQVYDAAGNQTLRVLAFDPSMTAGVRVASADVNGDGTPDIIAGTGPGVPAEVRVLDGTNGTLLFSTRPFEGFTGGVFVAAGDMDGDGRAEFAVSPDMGGGPRVVVYRGTGFLQAISFLGIDDVNFRGGARVGLADMNGDGRADLLVSAGFMGGPRVAGFEGSQLLAGTPQKLFNDFFAFEPGLRNGVYLAGGDITGDGIGDLIVGAGPDGGPRVTIYDGASLLANRPAQVGTFFAGNDTRRGGVRVATGDVDGDGIPDVITGEADGPRVNLFYGKHLKTGLPGTDLELLPFSSPMNGVFVG